MSKWVARSSGVAARNGTATHTITFTPATSSSLLVLLVSGAVTNTTPTGWAQAAIVGSADIVQCWTKTATAGESSLSTTHNGSDYPVAWAVYEFPAGSALGTPVTQSLSAAASVNTAWPSVTAAAGQTVLAALGYGVAPGSSTSALTHSWGGGFTSDLDVLAPDATTDGAYLGVGYADDLTAGPTTPTTAINRTSGSTGEDDRILLPLTVAAAGATVSQFVLSRRVTVG